MTIEEAKLLAKRIVACDAGGISEALSDCKKAVVCAGDAEALAEAIEGETVTNKTKGGNRI